MINEAVANGARKHKACQILEVSMRTIERWEKNLIDGRKGPKTKPSHALKDEEIQEIIDVVNHKRYCHLSPSVIVPMLADEGRYLGSESTFYRVLRKNKLLQHRSNANPPMSSRPDTLIATKPNQVWSWDITYLKSEIKGKYYYLYLPVDIFSRMIVYWEVHEYESAELAAEMIARAYACQGISKGQITLHSDNGGPMKGATMLATLQRLEIAPSFSRPRVSDDNAFSEALFKTLKYLPQYPRKGFASIDQARKWVEEFVLWYNCEHLHSGIKYVTPYSRHQYLDIDILKRRRNIYEQARNKNPKRWSGNIRNFDYVDAAALNNEKADLITVSGRSDVGALVAPQRRERIA